MPKTISSQIPTSARPPATPEPKAAGVRQGRRRKLAAGAALVVIGAGVAGWRWHRRDALAPAPPAALALQPTEARLLTAAGREPANPQPYLELGEAYAASKRPASALWAYSEAE